MGVFTANLQQSRGRIPDALLVKLAFSLIVICYFTKSENKTKKSLTQLSHYCFGSRYYFYQKSWFFSKTCWHHKRALVLEGMFSETLYLCVLTCKIWSVVPRSPLPQNEPVKSPPRLRLNLCFVFNIYLLIFANSWWFFLILSMSVLFFLFYFQVELILSSFYNFQI